jgi:hypothetical protein
MKISYSDPSMISFDDNIYVIPNAIRSAICLQIKGIASSSECEYMDTQKPIHLTLPINPIAPVASLSAPVIVSTCEDIPLDPTNSYGKVISEWKSIRWNVRATMINNTETPEMSIMMTNYLNTNFQSTNTLLIIPNEILKIGKYWITMSLMNVFNQSSSTMILVSMQNIANLPNVRILGPKSITIYRANTLRLSTIATISNCLTKTTSLNTSSLNFQWTIFKGLSSIDSISSISKDPRSYVLSPYSLTALNSYAIQVTVYSSILSAATASINVQVLLNQVYAIISGGSFITHSVDNSFLLDGRESYSLDNTTASLRYAWTCVEISPLFYGEACQGISLTTASSNLLSFDSYALSGSTRTLYFTLFVTSIEGITSNATLTLELQPSFFAPTLLLAPPLTKYNANNKIILTGRIIANGAYRATWSILDNSLQSNNNTFTTPRILTSSAGERYIQQAISPNILTAGGSYYIRLSAFYLGASSSQTVYSQILIQINEGPKGGVIYIRPLIGYAFNTSFSISTWGWSDLPENLPLEYTYEQVISSAFNPQLLSTSTSSTAINALLAAGNSFDDYNTTVRITATDAIGASTKINGFVIVQPKILPSTQLTQNLLSLLSSSNQDTAKTIQVISAVTLTLNTVNCSKVPPDYCSSLNRKGCTTTTQTCGVCLDGYIGILGDANSVCSLPTSVSSSSSSSGVDGSSCTSNDQCLSGLCGSNKCIPTQKKCPSDCSNRGLCRFYAYNGTRIDYCYTSNPYCVAKCSCNSNAFGADCRLTAVDYVNYRIMRSSMCTSLFKAAATQNVNSHVAFSQAVTIANILQDPNQIDLYAYLNCTAVLLQTVTDYPTVSADPDVLKTIVDAFGTVLTYPDIPTDMISLVTEALYSLTSGMQSFQAIGESQQQFILNNFRMGSIVVHGNDSSSNTTITNKQSIPTNALEKLKNNPTNSIQLNSSRILVTSNEGVGIAVHEYSQDITKNNTLRTPAVAVKISTTKLTTSSVTFSQGTAGKSVVNNQRRRLDNSDVADVAIEITLHNMKSIQYYENRPVVGQIYCLRRGFNYTQHVYCEGGNNFTFMCPGTYGKVYNYTCPKYTLNPYCVSWNGEEYKRSPNCVVKEYSPTNTTCLCTNTLTAPSAASPLAIRDKTSSTLLVSSIAVVDITDLQNIITYEGSEALTPVEKDIIIVISTSILVALFLIGMLSWGYYDKTTDVRPKGLRRFLFAETIPTTKKLLKNTKNRPGFIDEMTKGFPLITKNNYYPIFSTEFQQDNPKASLLSYLSPSKQGPRSSTRSKKLSIDLLYNAVLPTEFSFNNPVVAIAEPLPASSLHSEGGDGGDMFFLNNLSNHNNNKKNDTNFIGGLPYTRGTWWDTFKELFHAKYYEEHDLYHLFYHNSETDNEFLAVQDPLVHPENWQKSIRWILIIGRLISFFFWDTFFIRMYFADDGTCEHQTTQLDCMKPKTLFGREQLCYWEERLDKYCEFNNYPVNNYLNIAIIITISLILTKFFEHFFRFILLKYFLFQYEERMKNYAKLKKLLPNSNPAATNTINNNIAKVIPVKENRKASVPSKKTAAPASNKASKATAVANKRGSNALTTLKNGKESEDEGISYRITSGFYELRDILDNKGKLLRAARLFLIQNVTDKVSSNKETFFITYKIPLELCQQYVPYSYLMSSYYFLLKFRQSEEEDSVGDIKLRNTYALQLQSEIRSLRNELRIMKVYMNYLERDIDRDIFLLQNFLISCLPNNLERNIAKFYFLKKFAILDLHLPTGFLYLGLASLFVCYVLMISYIYFFGTRIGARSTTVWLAIWGICIGMEWIILQPLLTMFKWIVIPSMIKPTMMFYHAILRERTPSILNRRYGLIRTVHSAIQHFNLGCRLARFFPDLSSARLLISLHDYDLLPDHWSKHNILMKRFTFFNLWKGIISILFYIPFMMIPLVVQEFFIDFLLIFIICMAGIGLLIVRSISPWIAIGIGGVIVLLGLSLPISILITKYRERQAKMRQIIPIDDGNNRPPGVAAAADDNDLESSPAMVQQRKQASSLFSPAATKKPIHRPKPGTQSVQPMPTSQASDDIFSDGIALTTLDEIHLRNMQLSHYDFMLDYQKKLTFQEYLTKKKHKYHKIMRKILHPEELDTSEEERERVKEQERLERERIRQLQEKEAARLAAIRAIEEAEAERIRLEQEEILRKQREEEELRILHESLETIHLDEPIKKKEEEEIPLELTIPKEEIVLIRTPSSQSMKQPAVPEQPSPADSIQSIPLVESTTTTPIKPIGTIPKISPRPELIPELEQPPSTTKPSDETVHTTTTTTTTGKKKVSSKDRIIPKSKIKAVEMLRKYQSKLKEEEENMMDDSFDIHYSGTDPEDTSARHQPQQAPPAHVSAATSLLGALIPSLGAKNKDKEKEKEKKERPKSTKKPPKLPRDIVKKKEEMKKKSIELEERKREEIEATTMFDDFNLFSDDPDAIHSHEELKEIEIYGQPSSTTTVLHANPLTIDPSKPIHLMNPFEQDLYHQQQATIKKLQEENDPNFYFNNSKHTRNMPEMVDNLSSDHGSASDSSITGRRKNKKLKLSRFTNWLGAMKASTAQEGGAGGGGDSNNEMDFAEIYSSTEDKIPPKSSVKPSQSQPSPSQGQSQAQAQAAAPSPKHGHRAHHPAHQRYIPKYKIKAVEMLKGLQSKLKSEGVSSSGDEFSDAIFSEGEHHQGKATSLPKNSSQTSLTAQLGSSNDEKDIFPTSSAIEGEGIVPTLNPLSRPNSPIRNKKKVKYSLDPKNFKISGDLKEVSADEEVSLFDGGGNSQPGSTTSSRPPSASIIRGMLSRGSSTNSVTTTNTNTTSTTTHRGGADKKRTKTAGFSQNKIKAVEMLQNMQNKLKEELEIELQETMNIPPSTTSALPQPQPEEALASTISAVEVEIEADHKQDP